MFVWIYQRATGEFLYGGPCEQAYAPSTQGQVRLTRNPRPRTERYDGAGGVRPATAQEIADYDATQTAQREAERFDGEKLVKALAIWAAQRFGVPLATARAEIMAIYRGLP